MSYVVRVNGNGQYLSSEENAGCGYQLWVRATHATKFPSRRAAECFVTRISARHNWSEGVIMAVKAKP